jgi:4-hydroxybutyryl-CoA dehydratase / vinylacetyl-CoA-Delta-isomerase
MAVKTAAEYIESLRDGRLIYAGGNKIYDIVKNEHAGLKAGLRMAAFEYVIAADPRYRDLLIEADESGEPCHFVYNPPRTPADLIRRREIIQKLARICCGVPGASHFTGIDALHAITAISQRMDKEGGTDYSARVMAFMEECKHRDLGLACGMSGTGQSRGNARATEHKDFSINVVDRSTQGVTLNGVMAHMTFVPYTHEIIILPAHGMREEDREHAIAMAIPVNSKGVSLILPHSVQSGPGDRIDHPLLSRVYTADSMVIFDNVFVPCERIFMDGEYRFAGQCARLFASIHRLSGDSRKAADLESLVGSAFLIAEYNGLEKFSHVQEKLSQLVYYAETTDALARAAALDCITDPATGYVFPNPLLSNLAKYTFADYWHQAVKMVQDIAGGLVATLPSGSDLDNPELHSTLAPYLSGREGAAAEDRIRAVNLVRDFSMPEAGAATIHGEGSLIMQKMTILREADRSRYLSAAKRAAGIHDTNPHPAYNDIPDLSLAETLLEGL